MSIEILDCLKRKRDVCIKNIIPSQNTAFKWIPSLKCCDCGQYQNISSISALELFSSAFLGNQIVCLNQRSVDIHLVL